MTTIAAQVRQAGVAFELAADTGAAPATPRPTGCWHPAHSRTYEQRCRLPAQGTPDVRP